MISMALEVERKNHYLQQCFVTPICLKPTSRHVNALMFFKHWQEVYHCPSGPFSILTAPQPNPNPTPILW